MNSVSAKFNGILLVTVLAGAASAQQTISKTTEKIILESSRQTVLNYTKFIELLGQEDDKNLMNLYKAELYKSVQHDSINVFNDIIPLDDRPKNLRDNLERIKTYVNDINTRYLNGVTIIYTNVEPGRVFIDEQRDRLFVKVTSIRSIDGMYQYKNESKHNESREKINFYLHIVMKPSGIPESKIFAITIDDNSEAGFKPVKVVEKTAPILFSSLKKDTILKRATEHTIIWTGGEIYERLKLDLYKRSSTGPTKLLTIDSSFVNDNKIKFVFGNKLKPGKKNKYFFQITKLSSEELPATSEVFYIKRKIPLALKIATPVIVIAGVTYWIWSASQTKELPVLPGPIDPN